MVWYCQLDWSEARWFVQSAITALGIVVSVGVAVSIPRRHKRQDGLTYARAASAVLEQMVERIWDRLDIRFDPPSYEVKGRWLRQHRADAALATLADLKVAEMPVELVPSFSAARSSLGALNAVMNAEKAEDWPPAETELKRYRRVWRDALSAVAEFNRAASAIGVARVTVPPLAAEAAQACGAPAPASVEPADPPP
ncbi:MAG TPA: hypothetical protein VF782_07405 [Allosphingosinicella sp.]